MDAVDWNYYSKAYIWSPVNQKMYFFRDETSPNDLLWEEINASGTAYPVMPAGAIGIYKDSPLHTSTGFSHPIVLSPNESTVLVGSGLMHNAVTLERITPSISAAFTDAAWRSGGVYTSRTNGKPTVELGGKSEPLRQALPHHPDTAAFQNIATEHLSGAFSIVMPSVVRK